MSKEEYWTLGSDGEGASGPFDTIEEAKEDALEYLHSNRFRIEEIKIVKVVAASSTEVSFATTWKAI